MNDDEIVNYCKRLIMHNLSNNGFTNEVAAVLGSDVALLDHCYGIRDLMQKCIEILENRGISLDDK